jgi:hypothetical protein
VHLSNIELRPRQWSLINIQHGTTTTAERL